MDSTVTSARLGRPPEQLRYVSFQLREKRLRCFDELEVILILFYCCHARLATHNDYQ